MTVIRDSQGRGIDTNNPLMVKVNGLESNSMTPTDIQSHLQQTIQTHAGVTVPPNGNSIQSSWIDTDGFDKFGVTLLNDGAITCSVSVLWSNDGSTIQGIETPIASSQGTYKSGIVDTKSRYAKIQVVNGDATLAHSMSAWVYLKA